MKRLLFVFLIGCHALLGWSTSPNETDSLLQRIKTLPHDSTRLLTLNQLVQLNLFTPQSTTYSDMLAKEAKTQNNDQYRGIAASQKVAYYYSRNNQDSVNKWLNVIEPIARKTGMWNLYFTSQQLQIDMYSRHEQFEFAINEAIKMRKLAIETNHTLGLVVSNQSIAKAYIRTNRLQEGKQYLEKAYKLLPFINDPNIHLSVLSQLISAAKTSNDNKSMIKYLKEQEKVLNESVARNPALKYPFYNTLLFNNIYYAYYYLNIEQEEQAYEYLKRADQYISGNTFFTFRMLYHDVYAAYHRARKEYDLALSRIDSTIACLKEIQGSDYNHQQAVKADILQEAGRNNEAYEWYQKAFSAKDSVNTSISDKQMEQIKGSFNIDRVKLDKEQLKSEIQTITLVIVAIILLILLVFIVRISKVRKALQISEQDTREANRIAQEANEMKNRFLSNMSYNIRIPLNGVVGFSQLIATEPDMDEETRKEYSDIIQTKSQELIRLVNDVLDLSRLEAGMMKFQIQEYDVSGLCNEVLYMADMQNKGSIKIQFNNHIESPADVTIDAGRLTQALVSALTYPQPCKEQRKVTFTVTQSDRLSEVEFRIVNSPLANKVYYSQEVSIRHEINRLLLEHFGGSYTHLSDAPEGPVIVFIYPLKNSR